jgi:protein TonB
LESQPRPFVPSQSYRYDSGRRSRKPFLAALLTSAALHLGVLFGIGPAEKKAVPQPGDYTIPINLEFIQIKELEETEPLPSDEPAEAPDAGIPVPMLADVPHVPLPTDFVQPLDFASLIEQPSMDTSNVVTIPNHISRSSKIGDGLGTIFNLSDLDRHPTAVFQPAPVVTGVLKQENAAATVRVQFIVKADGRVVNVFVVDSTDHRFDDTAINGVSKWKFKPGTKGGRKVNTWMMVPIVFKVQVHH